jgi:hypothetical protein
MAEKKYKNGARYVGSVSSDGERNGQGTYYYTDGSTYQGAWRNGEKHGQGVQRSADGSIKRGTWNCNVFVGETSSSSNTVKSTTNNKQQKQTSMKKTGILGNLGLELGKYTGDQLAYSPAGIAVKKKDGSYVVYDRNTKTLIEIGDLKMDVPFYLVPSLYDQLQPGDLIKLDGSFYTVEAKTEANGLKLQSPTTGSYAYKPARTTLFGLYFYTKVVSMLDTLGGGGLFGAPAAGAPAAGAAANPFGGGFNPMLLMLMNKDNGSNGGLDLTQLMLMSQFSGGGVGSLNPLMLMAMSGSGGDSDDLMQLLLMSQVAGTGANPLANLFGGAKPAAPAEAPVAAPAAPEAN